MTESIRIDITEQWIDYLSKLNREDEEDSDRQRNNDGHIETVQIYEEKIKVRI